MHESESQCISIPILVAQHSIYEIQRVVTMEVRITMTIIEAYTLMHAVESSNWLFRWSSDKLGMAFMASLFEVTDDADAG